MLRLLVADDHEIVRKGLVKVLAEILQPIKVDEAKNGQEALGKVLKGEYDLVVLDIKMPGKSGLDVLKEIKAAQAEAARPDPQHAPGGTVRDTCHARRRLRVPHEGMRG